MGSRATRQGFESLGVYQLAERLADAVWELATTWKVFARDTVGKQMVRSADSIGANIAEGFGRGTYQDNRRFVRIARGSLYETRHWLRRAFRRGLLSKGQVASLKPILEELGPRLNAYLNSIGPVAVVKEAPMPRPASGSPASRVPASGSSASGASASSVSPSSGSAPNGQASVDQAK